MQGEGRVRSAGLPGRYGSWSAGAVHEQAGAIQLPCSHQGEHRLIDGRAQAKVIGMQIRPAWIGLLLAAEASGPVPDQGIQHGGREHQHQRWCLQQWQQCTDAEVDGVLEQQPAPGKAATTRFLAKGDESMAVVARQRGGEEGERIGQGEVNPTAQQQQNPGMDRCGQHADGAVTPQFAQQRQAVHRSPSRRSSASIRRQASRSYTCTKSLKLWAAVSSAPSEITRISSQGMPSCSAT